MKLKEICENITDGSHNPPSGIEGSEYLMLSSKNVFNDKITLEEPRYLSEEQFLVEDKRTCIKAGDVLMTIVGTVGRAAVVTNDIPKITLQRSVAVLHPISDVCNSRFLMYLLQSKKKFFEQEAHGVAQKGIYLKQLSEISVSLPAISQQEDIVDKLDRINKTIKSRQLELDKLGELIKARFVELFGDMILNPNGWEQSSLGKVCDVRDGTHDSPKYYMEGYPLVTSKNVTSGKIDFSDCSLICEDDYEKINQRSKVDYGDILMPMIGTVGNPVIVDVEPKFAIKNVALIKFYEDSSVLNTFVKGLLESDYFDRAVISKVRGGTQKFIALGNIRELQISIPPMNIQLDYQYFVQQVDKSKSVA